MKDEVRIVLVGAAKAAHDQMLADIRTDKNISINSSKLINWIVEDYFNYAFEKRKLKICKAYFNPRKCIMAAMKSGDSEQIRHVLNEAIKNFSPRRFNRHQKMKPLKIIDAPTDHEENS